MNSITITPAFKGTITPLDLLTPEGTFIFNANINDLRKGGLFFELLGDGYIFQFGSNQEGLYARRNEVLSILSYEEIKEESFNASIYLIWCYNKISIYFFSEIKKKQAEVMTNPCSPPLSLIKWARKESLIETTEYENEEKLREKVYSCLLSIQDDINQYASINPFWDIHYSGQKILNRTPKKETDIHPTISLLLSKQMLLAGIDLVPEYQTGVGNLDFMFIGKIKNNGLSKICVEFKNAHSVDLVHGLEHQLPDYMCNTGSNYGAYCVLYYKGDWFNEPDLSMNELEMQLSICQRKSSNPLVHEGIRVIIYSLAKKISASKKK